MSQEQVIARGNGRNLEYNAELIAESAKAEQGLNLHATLAYLTYTFNEAFKRSGLKVVSPFEGPESAAAGYRVQQEFAYKLDMIKRGPRYLVPKLVAEANSWIGDPSLW